MISTREDLSDLPASCAIAFKEWAGVCRAIGVGRQCIILRKGGIAEGPDGFQPEHSAFWLYPTHVHEAEQGLRAGKPEALGSEGMEASTIPVETLVQVTLMARVDSETVLDSLEPFHVWTAQTVLKRFRYRSPGLWVLGARAFRKPAPALLPVTAAHAGCKSWVPLETALGTSDVRPVLDEPTAHEALDRLRAILERTRTP